MVKFALYYGVDKDGKKEVIALKDRCELAEVKAQCKKDCQSASIAKKYVGLVVATNYGIVSRKKVIAPEEPSKKAPPKKAPAKKASK